MKGQRRRHSRRIAAARLAPLRRASQVAVLALALACAGHWPGGMQAPEPPPGPLPTLSPAAHAALVHASDLVVVETARWSAPTGTLTLLRRTKTGWKVAEGPIPADVGRTGLGWGRGLTLPPAETPAPVKHEGDGRAPAGIFRFGSAMGYTPAPPRPFAIPYRQLTERTVCVDDTKSDSYNRLADLAPGAAPAWSSDETMRRKDDVYQLLLLVDHNGILGDAPTKVGAGSCIFLHRWRGPGHPTVGCTAIDGSALESLVAQLPSLGSTLLVQLPAPLYAEAEAAWALPALPAAGREP